MKSTNVCEADNRVPEAQICRLKFGNLPKYYNSLGIEHVKRRYSNRREIRDTETDR